MLLQKVDGTLPSSAPAFEGAVLGSRSHQVSTQDKPAAASPASEPTPPEIHSAVQQANRSLRTLATTLEFEIDPETKTTVIKLIDTADRKVLRQVPSREMLDIAKAMDRVQGLLIRHTA